MEYGPEVETEEEVDEWPRVSWLLRKSMSLPK
jgi:hypothetical protein